MFFCVQFSFDKFSFLLSFKTGYRFFPESQEAVSDWSTVIYYFWLHVEFRGKPAELILFYYVVSRAQPQVFRLSSWHLYPLAHLAGPQHVFLTMGEVGKICTSEQRVSSLNKAGVRGQYDGVLAQHERVAGKGKDQATLGSTGTCLLVTASLRLAWVYCKNYSAHPSPASFSLEQRRKRKEGRVCV